MKHTYEYLQKITSLNHEFFDNSMELAIFESHRFVVYLEFPSAELSEVLCSFRDYISEKLHFYATSLVSPLKFNL